MLLICLQSNAEQLRNAVFCHNGIYEKILEVVGLQGFALICQIFQRCGRKMNLICNHLVLNILCSPIPSVQHIIQSLDFTVLRCVTAGVPFDANIAKFRYAKSKCSHKFTHALEPVCKRLVMFHGLHIIVRLKAEQDMRRNAQRGLAQKGKLGILIIDILIV